VAKGENQLYGYLIGMAVIATMTSLALFAPRRPRALAGISFVFGIAINELPLYGMIWAGVSMAPIVLGGRVTEPGALGGTTLGLLALIGLVVILRRGLGARATLVGALRESGLDAPAQHVIARASWRRTLATLIAPFATWAPGVQRVRNLRYGPNVRRHRLDVLRSRSATTPGPVLVYFHGGGYSSGRKNWEARRLLYRFAHDGWTCVTADYRLRPEVGFEGHLADLGAVLAWVRDHAAAYGGDPARIVLAGSSAGAHMGSIAALAPDHPALGEGRAVAAELAAVVCLYGYLGPYYGRGGDSPSTSPIDHASSPGPPFLVVHGDNDTYVPVELARRFVAERRRSPNSTTVYAELRGAQHAFDVFRSPRFESVVDAVTAFLGPAGVAGRRVSAPSDVDRRNFDIDGAARERRRKA